MRAVTHNIFQSSVAEGMRILMAISFKKLSGMPVHWGSIAGIATIFFSLSAMLLSSCAPALQFSDPMELDSLKRKCESCADGEKQRCNEMVAEACLESGLYAKAAPFFEAAALPGVGLNKSLVAAIKRGEWDIVPTILNGYSLPSQTVDSIFRNSIIKGGYNQDSVTHWVVQGLIERDSLDGAVRLMQRFGNKTENAVQKIIAMSLKVSVPAAWPIGARPGAFSLSKDGKYLAFSRNTNYSCNANAQVWSVAEGKMILRFPDSARLLSFLPQKSVGRNKLQVFHAARQGNNYNDPCAAYIDIYNIDSRTDLENPEMPQRKKLSSRNIDLCNIADVVPTKPFTVGSNRYIVENKGYNESGKTLLVNLNDGSQPVDLAGYRQSYNGYAVSRDSFNFFIRKFDGAAMARQFKIPDAVCRDLPESYVSADGTLFVIGDGRQDCGSRGGYKPVDKLYLADLTSGTVVDSFDIKDRIIPEIKVQYPAIPGIFLLASMYNSNPGGPDIQSYYPDFNSNPAAVIISSDNKYLIVGISNAIKIWDIKEHRVVRVIRGEWESVRSLALSPDQTKLFASTYSYLSESSGGVLRQFLLGDILKGVIALAGKENIPSLGDTIVSLSFSQREYERAADLLYKSKNFSKLKVYADSLIRHDEFESAYYYLSLAGVTPDSILNGFAEICIAKASNKAVASWSSLLDRSIAGMKEVEGKVTNNVILQSAGYVASAFAERDAKEALEKSKLYYVKAWDFYSAAGKKAMAAELKRQIENFGKENQN
jgi:hypothetical protein